MSVEIYALLDPQSGAIRYIGKANCAAKRLKTHLRDSVRRDTPVYRWIRKLTRMGLLPGLQVLRTVEEGDWESAERQEIAAAIANGERLLNLAEGGNQPYCPAEVRRANGAYIARTIHGHPKRKRIWALKRAVGNALKRGLVSEAAKAKLRYAARKAPHLFGEFAAV